MHDEMIIPKSELKLYFSPKDNDGKGNCFYNGILFSNRFVQTANFEDSYENSLELQRELQRFAVENEKLSNLIFEREVDQMERKDVRII
jgi:hypothetical protein